jgi:hypothetical protein
MDALLIPENTLMNATIDPETITETTLIAAIPNQVSTTLDDETVILSLADGTYYGLNAVGTSIWNLIQQPTTVQHILDALLEEYDVDRETCAKDLQALIEDLKAHQLIQDAQ